MRFQVAVRFSDSVAMEKNMIEGFLKVLWRFFSGFFVVFFSSDFCVNFRGFLCVPSFEWVYAFCREE